jgi:GR25 family glycosyltransferase involved in LPS biosynthesis
MVSRHGIQRITKTKPFLLLLFYIITSVFIVPFVGMRLPCSVFYQSQPVLDRVRVDQENHRRVGKAEMILRAHTNRKEMDLKNPEFCFVIPSVSRPAEVHYLTQVVAALLPQVSYSHHMLMVFNGEGSKHTEAENLSSIIHVETATGQRSQDAFMNEKADYVYCLNWCLNRGAKFSVILEDDVLPPDDFIQRLKFLLQYRMPKNEKGWAFLKLYYPEKWEGWGNEWRLVLELVVTSLFGGLVMTSLIYIIQLFLVRSLPSKLEFLIVYFLSSVLVIYTLYSLGRPHWLSLRKWSPHFSSVVSSPGCCTPAVVYPQAHLVELIRYLRSVNCSRRFPLDLALDNFASENKLEHLLVVPNMVTHIGFISSLGKYGNEPQYFIFS